MKDPQLRHDVAHARAEDAASRKQAALEAAQEEITDNLLKCLHTFVACVSGSTTSVAPDDMRDELDVQALLSALSLLDSGRIVEGKKLLQDTLVTAAVETGRKFAGARLAWLAKDD